MTFKCEVTKQTSKPGERSTRVPIAYRRREFDDGLEIEKEITVSDAGLELLHRAEGDVELAQRMFAEARVS